MPWFAVIYDMKPVARDYKDEGFIRTRKSIIKSDWISITENRKECNAYFNFSARRKRRGKKRMEQKKSEIMVLAVIKREWHAIEAKIKIPRGGKKEISIDKGHEK